MKFDVSSLKNYGLWVSIAALIPLVLSAFGINIVPDKYNEIVNAILAILVMLGILNNPTTQVKGFGDDPVDVKKIEK